jgi:hypothetical protein
MTSVGRIPSPIRGLAHDKRPVQVIGHPVNDIAQLDLFHPPRRQASGTDHPTQKVSGDAPGAVAIA